MNILLIAILFVAAYLIGSICTAVWLGKWYYGIDIRKHGSGNSGATNTFRVLGKKPGTIVMLIDIFKGWAATSLANLLVLFDAIPAENLIVFQLLMGMLAVVGHIFPVYERFKGGKGVATLLGMMLAIQPEAALVCIVVFVIVLFVSKYVSLGSMIAALAFPMLLLLHPHFHPDNPILIIFGFILFAIVVITHRKNINRLIAGEESKANITIGRKR
ncbi:glycerol-3-phosphate 1-O-acyltransferase PlsY [Pontibacter sp. BT310]|jgi:acyl phosphate:glycerol-3-phosphate acyltransferase|uniref:Glycerol-3-phosphate acyltransferase n=1 Tax=Pontibacter populi TaxID=890055 RepID=A0ABS6XFM1_9BACT|nr:MULTISPECIES: glycerol-3-phosphate 1-O-acyltransferase PlsY [Pontibacter]MBJ6119833.1 glycerol-3-phosphate 1-O-acyltransferase PlsY [Pontibacter sp. BT310]MBR0572262.1 glycerol-3-phosphate 1-O-acyltransferase PlsY [Microvirga sp. STS03]MBW3366686.1 glycerol-3-phosphate 1-O-acyltransferase PlsY [Pontibacter populi]